MTNWNVTSRAQVNPLRGLSSPPPPPSNRGIFATNGALRSARSQPIVVHENVNGASLKRTLLPCESDYRITGVEVKWSEHLLEFFSLLFLSPLSSSFPEIEEGIR